MRYFLFLLIAMSCSTAGEKEVVITVKGGKGAISFGKINQALIYLRSFAEKSDIVEKAGYIVLAHGASTFYGYPWDENSGGEEAFLRTICKKLGLKTDTTWKCAVSLSRDILAQSTNLLKDFCKIQRIKKQCGELQKEFIEILELRLEGPLKPIQCAVNEGKRIKLSGKTDFNRIPEGYTAVMSGGKISTGSFDAIGIDSFHVTDLLTRAASLSGERFLTLVPPGVENIKNFNEFVRIAVDSGLRTIVLWGEDKDGIGKGRILKINTIKFTEDCKEMDKICSTPAGKGLIIRNFKSIQDISDEMEKSATSLLLIREVARNPIAVPLFEKSIIEPEDLLKVKPTVIK